MGVLKVEFDFHVQFAYADGRNRKVDMDEFEWAEAKVKEVQIRRKQRELSDQKSIMETSLKKAHAPELWSRIRTLIKSRAGAFSKTLGEEDIFEWVSPKANEVVIRIKNTRTQITASFDPETLKLKFFLVDTGAEFDPTVQNGEVVFVEYRGSPCTAEEIAERFVNHIIDFI